MDKLFNRYTKEIELLSVEITEDNITELARFFGWAVRFHPTDQPVLIAQLGMQSNLHVGDWVTSTGTKSSEQYIETNGWQAS